MQLSPQSSQRNGAHYAGALIWMALLLTGIGLLIIYSSSSIPAFQKFGDTFYFLKKQAMVAILGLVAIVTVQSIPFRWIERFTIPCLIVAVLLLCMTHIPGVASRVNGASRWISIAGVSFQPAEFAKLALILFLAKNLARPAMDLTQPRSLISNFGVVGLLVVLLMLQPDFGSTFVLCTITFLMLLVAGLPRKLVVSGAVTSFVLIALAIWHAPYRLARLLSYLDPWRHVKNGGFQIIQSYLGFQNGGLLGLGLGESRQKLYFLPEAHTDFILSVIGEELGLVGVLLVVFIFAYMTWLGWQICRLQTVGHRKFLAFGLTALITIQASINMGVTMGLLPTKGIPLPFVSSGASSLIAFMIVVALLARLGKEAVKTSHGETA